MCVLLLPSLKYTSKTNNSKLQSRLLAGGIACVARLQCASLPELERTHMTHLVTLQRSPALAAASVDVEPGTRDLRSLFGVACPPRLALACVAGSEAPRIRTFDTETSQQWQLPMYSCYNCLSKQTKFSPMAAEENYQGGTWKGNVSPTADFACLALLPKAQRDKNKQSWIRASSQNMKSMTCPRRTMFCDNLCLNK